MENVITRLIELPPRIKAMTVMDEAGNYNVYLNANSTMEANAASFLHELRHIDHDDFYSQEDIRTIERRACEG